MNASVPSDVTPRHLAIVPAAGTGSRLGADRPKQYLALGTATVLEQTVARLLACDWIDSVAVLVAPDDRIAAALPGLRQPRCTCLPVGGPTRRDTVLNGLAALKADQRARPFDWIWVHDAARPGVTVDCLRALKQALVPGSVGALLALPVVDTVTRVEADGRATTVDRVGLWAAQTPQVFPFERLCGALSLDPHATDEASAVERAGGLVRRVPGERGNFKVTTMDDLIAMRAAFSQPGFRVGQGWDVHALVPGRTLTLGGVAVPHSHGLLGHSDADVLLHAVTDALLGGAGLGDIGRHFPDTDPHFSGADSRLLLREALSRVRQAGWKPVQLDSTVVAERPKLAAYIPDMVANIAADLSLPVSAVNVKAKTSERLGYEGRGEGVSAQAMVVLIPQV